VELVLSCVNNSVSAVDETEERQRESRGFKRSRDGADNGLDTSFQSIEIVPALVVGFFNALFAYPYGWFLRWLFIWGNRRQHKGRTPPPASRARIVPTVEKVVAASSAIAVMKLAVEDRKAATKKPQTKLHHARMLATAARAARAARAQQVKERIATAVGRLSKRGRRSSEPVLPVDFLPSRHKKSARDPNFTEQLSRDTVSRWEAFRRRLAEARWITDRWYCIRQSTAWITAFFLQFVTAIMAMAYATTFGNDETTKMLMGWLISVGWCFFIIEPIQIVIVSVFPFCINPDSRCGQCFDWTRWAYNEYFAP